MSWEQKQLAFIQLAAAKGDVFDPTLDSVVHNILIHNTNSASETVELLYHDGTSEYQILNVSVEADDTLFFDFPGEGIVVPSTAKLTGNTTTGSMVTCLICGSEESA